MCADLLSSIVGDSGGYYLQHCRAAKAERGELLNQFSRQVGPASR